MATKKALLVGINRYINPGNNLRGCVNDVENMHNILTRLFKFNPDNIRVVTDKRATKTAILERLNWLIKDNHSGDELVFHYSGHGSQIRDRNGDELNDGLDEILCPTDLNWDDPLTDDALAILIKQVVDGANFTMIADCCHSGSITRELLPPGCGCDKEIIYKKSRFMVPPFDIAARSSNRELPVRVIGSKGIIEEPQNHVLISGCRDDQTSSDAYLNKKYQGAMTWSLTSAIKSNSALTWNHVIVIIRDVLKKVGFDQVPQLSGNEVNLNRPIFGGR